MPAKPPHPHLPVREDWLALHQEEILEPALPIIDPHHHLWERPGNRYLFDEFRHDAADRHDIRATVFVTCRAMFRADGPEAMQPLGETEFVNGIAAQSASGLYGTLRACQGIVGHADLTLGDAVAPVLEAQLRIAGGRFRAIRNNTAWHPDPDIQTNPIRPPPGLLREARFRAGVARLSGYGLSLDIWAYHTQLPEVIDLARAFPDQPMVLDHVGGPIGIGRFAARRAEVFAEWRQAIRDLARLPNVTVKLGGLAMELGGFGFHQAATPPTSAMLAEAWRPYIETCIESFGADRAMFESNFPVDKGMCGYAVLWNAFKRLAAGATITEKRALFSGTAARVYRLPPPC
ncbi:amidohydrolase family protein [Roseomonas hellenica]|uniref:Amidohydrolase family protein n=1 Tax=Plastoroseomonas hellenica TaxID=2687306 RepID=A0ABS5F358_9PROT|nr:amidohydrolase family protein [Plastoroseomonas hellenica]MBR0666994.1 amidohydrolase family protein [Plastoroseomonas hellenica]